MVNAVQSTTPNRKCGVLGCLCCVCGGTVERHSSEGQSKKGAPCLYTLTRTCVQREPAVHIRHRRIAAQQQVSPASTTYPQRWKPQATTLLYMLGHTAVLSAVVRSWSDGVRASR